MKKVSVICPVYNGANFLPTFINNLLGYTFQDFEIIFVDVDFTALRQRALLAAIAVVTHDHQLER